MNLDASRGGVLMALGSMLCVQVGIAVAVTLMDRVGPEGAAWLRLFWGGVILVVLVRPRLRAFTRSALLGSVALGMVTALITLLFMAAVARIPLGTASALEFLGPLAVAVATGTGRARWLWPAPAAVGVVLLTRPWVGEVDGVGVLLALAAAVCWASYIVLTQRVGDAVTGVNALAVSMGVAGTVATVAVGPQVFDRITPQLLLIGVGLAVLLPVVPFTLEFLALRRLTTAAFGTLMSLEPAFAMVVGLLILHQVPAALGVAGLVLVVIAGVGAARSGARAVAVPAEVNS